MTAQIAAAKRGIWKKSRWYVVGLLALVLVAPTALSEFRAPGTLAETFGFASETIAPDAPIFDTLEWLRDEAKAALADLPGGVDVKVFAKADVGPACGNNQAIACSKPGGNSIWVGPYAANVHEIAVHEYAHLQTSITENLWLRANPQYFSNAENVDQWTAGLEGMADCMVQLLRPNWRDAGALSYMGNQECNYSQLTIARAVLEDRDLTALWLWVPDASIDDFAAHSVNDRSDSRHGPARGDQVDAMVSTMGASS